MRQITLTKAGLLALASLVLPAPHAAAQQEPPNPVSLQQPLVAGETTPDQILRELGLVTIRVNSSFCSGVALNAYWVLTAAHCVRDLTLPTPTVPPSQVTVTRAWQPGPLVVQDVRELFSESGIDAALVRTRLAMRTPNDPNSPEVTARPNDRVQWVETFGAGIYQLAQRVGGTDVAAVGDGQFRTAFFDVTGADASTLSLAIPPRVSIAGGDSGGPSYIRVWVDPNNHARGFRREVVGVASSCMTRRLDGHEDTPGWTWVSQVVSCRLAAVGPLRDRIAAIIADQWPAAEEQVSFGTSFPPGGMDRRRALYNLALDRPLVPPADGPMGDPLRFVTCVAGAVVFTPSAPAPSCPVENAFEVWGFVSARGWLVHLPSGRCAVASGLDQVRFGPCDAANPAHAWDITAQPPTSDRWTAMRNRGTGTCLAAAVPPGAERVSFRPAAELVLQSCNGSPRQGWSTVDADWSRRQGTR